MTTTMPELEEISMTDVFPYEDTDDGKDHMTHVINPDMNTHLHGYALDPTNPQELVDTARALGIEVIALCGFKFIPQRNPEKYPACSMCMTIAGLIMRSEGE